MEIKCKVSFILPNELTEALNITDDTAIIASVSNGQITLEIVDEDNDNNEDYLYDEDECECEGDCDECEYFCHHCGKCILD